MNNNDLNEIYEEFNKNLDIDKMCDDLYQEELETINEQQV